MAPLPQRSPNICSAEPRVPSTNTSLFSKPCLCQVILPASALGLSSGTIQNLNPKGLRHTAPGSCVCEAQTCSQQLTGSPGTRSCFQVPPTEFLCFDSFPQPELFKPEQKRGISSGTSWGHSQPSTGLLQKPDLRKRQDKALWKQTNATDN